MSEDAPKARPRRLIWAVVPVVVFAALAAAFLTGLQSGDPSVVPSALLDQPVPDFALEPLEGLVRDGEAIGGLSDEDLKQGQVTVVNVWASWCGPCRTEHPALMALYDEGVRIVGINYKDESENARRFLGTLGNPFVAVGVDDTGRSAIDWGVYGVPETFVIDGQGVIRYKHVGPIVQTALDELVRPAIQAASTPR